LKSHEYASPLRTLDFCEMPKTVLRSGTDCSQVSQTWLPERNMAIGVVRPRIAAPKAAVTAKWGQEGRGFADSVNTLRMHSLTLILAGGRLRRNDSKGEKAEGGRNRPNESTAVNNSRPRAFNTISLAASPFIAFTVTFEPLVIHAGPNRGLLSL
jgi:hypothetical protein